ncbi:DNA ligase 1-like [Clytia hemisphaerica]|uniref:DNA ligase 1-like n=1 Tax=Clytia hemisphaerica TaxID=252671 RepID=UPI0034D5A92C
MFPSYKAVKLNKRSEANKRERELVPVATPQPQSVLPAKRVRKKKHFDSDDYTSDEEGEQQKKKIKATDKDPVAKDKELETKDKEQQREQKKKDREQKKKENEQKKIQSEEKKKEKENLRIEKEKQKEEKEKEKQQKEKKKREKEEILKRKEEMFFINNFSENDSSLQEEILSTTTGSQSSTDESSSKTNESIEFDIDNEEQTFMERTQSTPNPSKKKQQTLPPPNLTPTAMERTQSTPNPSKKKQQTLPPPNSTPTTTKAKSISSPSSKQKQNTTDTEDEPISPRKRLIKHQSIPGSKSKSPYFKPKQCYFCGLKEKKITDLKSEVEILEEENRRLQQIIDNGNYVDLSVRPDSGILPHKIAAKYEMEKLVKGYDVYVTQEEFKILSVKKTGTGAVNFLLSLFYKHEELLEMNLEGRNGKKRVHPDILSAMTTYGLGDRFKESDAKLRVSLRNKIEQIKSRDKKEKSK